MDEAAIERWRRDGGDLPTSSSALLEASGVLYTCVDGPLHYTQHIVT